MTHSFMWRDAFIGVTWHVHMCDRVGDYFWSSFWVSIKQHYLSLSVIESLVKNVRVISETSWHCNTLQHIARQGDIVILETLWKSHFRDIVKLQHTATPCNTLQHTATHCNTLQHRGDTVILETLWKSHFNVIVNIIWCMTDSCVKALICLK